MVSCQVAKKLRKLQFGQTVLFYRLFLLSGNTMGTKDKGIIIQGNRPRAQF